jgi:hypothetical protein
MEHCSVKPALLAAVQMSQLLQAQVYIQNLRNQLLWQSHVQAAAVLQSQLLQQYGRDSPQKPVLAPGQSPPLTGQSSALGAPISSAQTPATASFPCHVKGPCSTPTAAARAVSPIIHQNGRSDINNSRNCAASTICDEDMCAAALRESLHFEEQLLSDMADSSDSSDQGDQQADQGERLDGINLMDSPRSSSPTRLFSFDATCLSAVQLPTVCTAPTPISTPTSRQAGPVSPHASLVLPLPRATRILDDKCVDSAWVHRRPSAMQNKGKGSLATLQEEEGQAEEGEINPAPMGSAASFASVCASYASPQKQYQKQYQKQINNDRLALEVSEKEERQRYSPPPLLRAESAPTLDAATLQRLKKDARTKSFEEWRRELSGHTNALELCGAVGPAVRVKTR